MADRRRSPVREALSLLLRLIALVVPLALLLWWTRDRGREAREPVSAPADGVDAPERRTVPGLSGPRAQRPGRGIARFEARVRSRLDIGRPPATAVGPVRIRLGDVVIDDPDGGAFARAATVEGTLDLEGAFAGRFVVRDVRLEGADVVLARASEGAPWNWERSLASLFGEDRGAAAASGPAPVVILEGVVVSNTRVVLRPGGADVFEFLDVDARLPVISISVPGTPPLFRLAELTTTVVSPGFERRIEVAISSALVRFPQDEVPFDVARVAVDGSRLLDAAGIWRPDAPGLGLKAALRAEAVSLADARVFVPELPAEGTADFRLAIEPLPEGRTDLRFSDLVARSGSSLVTGALAFAVGGEAPTTLIEVDLGLDGVSIDLLEPLAGPLPYAGTVSGTVVGPAAALDFDLSAELVARENGAPLRSRLTGRVSFGDAGFALVSLEAELQDVPLAALRPLVPGLALTGTVSGRVILRGGPADAPITLDISLVLAEGTILLAGELDLTGPIPTYDLTGRLIGIDLDALFEPALPPVALTARFVLRGSGLSAETATATLQLAGGFTGWEASVTDSVRIVARTAGEIISRRRTPGSPSSARRSRSIAGNSPATKAFRTPPAVRAADVTGSAASRPPSGCRGRRPAAGAGRACPCPSAGTAGHSGCLRGP